MSEKYDVYEMDADDLQEAVEELNELMDAHEILERNYQRACTLLEWAESRFFSEEINKKCTWQDIIGENDYFTDENQLADTTYWSEK